MNTNLLQAETQTGPAPLQRVIDGTKILVKNGPGSGRSAGGRMGIFSSPRDRLGQEFVYLVMSSRSRGLSIGINVNPDKACNFDCIYCDINRQILTPGTPPSVDPNVLAAELQNTLTLLHSGKIQERENYKSLPTELLQLKYLALSGDGEPTLSPNFLEVVQTIVHIRARGLFPPFKMVLMTNATGLDLPQVGKALQYFTRQDEIWAKLDGGTQSYLSRVNGPAALLDRILENILQLGRQRPVVIQSLFPLISGEEPEEAEIEAYADRLAELKAKGAMISLVQVYSASRPSPRSETSHLPLRSLYRIAQTVRQRTGLPTEVF